MLEIEEDDTLLIESVPRRACLFADMGLMSIPDAEELMNSARDLRVKGEIPDLLLFMAHPKAVALGLRERHSEHPKDLLVSLQRLAQEGIALTRSIRGGGITYHWPGQVVCYPVIALGPKERDIPLYMYRLEEIGIRTLLSLGIDASRRRDGAAYVGLWLGDKKVVSMGIRISSWVTSFGFVINLKGDHFPSTYIKPCGLEGVELVTVEEILGKAPPKAVILQKLTENFADIFDMSLEVMPSALRRKIG